MLLTRLSTGASSSPDANPILISSPISVFNLTTAMCDLTESATPPSTHHYPRALPVREDCWSEEATSTLIDAWGRRYGELNRGNLRQKDWQEIADAVNALHGHTKKTRRTDVQCKNRIDTIKKKYKVEKARVSSSWIFYDRMDSLIGPSLSSLTKPSPSSMSLIQSPPVALPLAYRNTPSSDVSTKPQKRADDGYFRRNYSAMAAAAAAAESEDKDDNGNGESEEEEMDSERESMKRLAKAIERFGEAYQRLEAEKLKQMVDLEKHRMQFAKDSEMQRMQMFMNTQVQLERIKRRKQSESNDIYG